jgi:hypothetical protein
MPFSKYGVALVALQRTMIISLSPISRTQQHTSIVPAMSICAHFIGASLPSSALIPSANAFKNNAAVQLPAGLPPVCAQRRIRHQGDVN